MGRRGSVRLVSSHNLSLDTRHSTKEREEEKTNREVSKDDSQYHVTAATFSHNAKVNDRLLDSKRTRGLNPIST